ncbi:MAG TPA: thiol reductant ABC exporter subunit CydD [Actinophytocola sp.]|jgi:thiol reductant ABC exporter CydD subunit/thiol reductant ABC exporter CydC subunit|nr:thiol reductant ABC exporter subunit CydD [Actinophytocola sp.]
MTGLLGRLSGAARRALVGCAVLAAFGAVALVAQAWALASVLADVVAGAGAPVGERLGVLAGAVLARAVLGWATQVVAARAAAGVKAELRAVLLDRALAAGPEWIAEAGAAELTALATRGLDALDGYFASYLPALVNAAVLPAGIGAVILVADWPSAVVIALTLPLVPVFAILIGLRTRDRVADAADATGRLSAHLLELARALPVLTAFRRAAAQADAVRRVSAAHRRAVMGTLRVAFASALVLELIATLSVALVAVTIGLRLVSGDLGLAVGLFVLVLAPECYLPLRAAGAAHHAAEDGLEAARRVAGMPVAPRPGGTAPPVGDLVVTGLKVRRRNGNAPDGSSLTARPGEVVRLDSPSGSGKSTLFAVLLGFVTPTEGRVQVGGVDLADLDLAAWRRRIAWVPQHPGFTGGTVAEEIGAAGSGPATAVGIAHLLDRPVDELSTGERQRVAVARALARDADLLLLDEPTAHLDPASAGLVMSAVHAAAARGAAVVLAAHRTTESTSDTPVASVVTPRVTRAVSVWPRLRKLLDCRLVAGAGLGAAALIAGVALTVTSAWLIAKAAQQPPILTLSVAVVGVRAFGLGRAVLRYLERLATHDAAFRAAGERRVALWRALVRRGPAHSRTDDLPRMVNDIDTVRDLTPRVLTPPLVAALVCVVAVTVQLAILPAAAVTLAIAVAAAGLGAPAAALALDRHAGNALAAARRRLATGTLALLGAAADLLAYGTDRDHRAALSRTDAALTRAARREAFGAGGGTLVITLATGAAAVAGTALATTAAANGTLDPLLAPVCALLPLALAEILALLPPATQHKNALRDALSRTDVTVSPTGALGACRSGVDAAVRGAVGRTEVTTAPADDVATVRSGADTALAGSIACAEVASQSAAVATVARSAGRVELRGVDVRWPGAEPVLRDVTLDIPPGTRVAVVGPSGAGKSTLLALLLGFLPPDRGTARVPGAVAWFPQEPQLVSTTVRENLRIGDPAATDEQLADALRQAGLPDWTDKLDTRLAGGDAAASGGEAQRFALARALLAAPGADLVILDEPTAHLDVPTAQQVLRRIDELPNTVIHVTHRAEEAEKADLIVEVAHGRVNSVRKDHSHPQGPPGSDVTGGDRQAAVVVGGAR